MEERAVEERAVEERWEPDLEDNAVIVARLSEPDCSQHACVL